VEHAFEFEEVRPWRTAAIVASAIAALELVALIVAGALIIARPLAHRTTVAVHRPPAAVAPKKKAKPKPPAILTRARTRIAVLNGNGETGAAATEADALRARGYKISSVGNAPQPVTGPSLVMYRPGFAAEGKRLAHDTGLVATAIDGLPTRLLGRSHLVILLGSG
jgi:LytR cell envelope-related transcriptional attenuator